MTVVFAEIIIPCSENKVSCVPGDNHQKVTNNILLSVLEVLRKIIRMNCNTECELNNPLKPK
jgi:hypothetical protein